MSQSDAEFSLIKDTSFSHDLKDHLRNSLVEVPFQELSGDEAIEKSFSTGSMHSSFFARKQKSNLFLSSITVMKSMVGVGILGIPNITKNFGILPTTLIILFNYVCTNFSMELLLKSKNMSRHSNYTTIGFHIFKNKKILVYINLTIIFCNLGTCLSELIIFGTTCENLVNLFTDYGTNPPFYLSRWFLIIIVGFLLIPLLIVRSIEKLRFVSLIAVLAVSSFSTIVVYNFFHLLAQDKLSKDYGLFPREFAFNSAFGSLPGAILAFNWLFNLFPVYKGMTHPSDERVRKATWIGSTMATGLYLLIGILGYMTYGNNVETNFLHSITEEGLGKVLYAFLNITFTLSTTMTLPIIFFGSRNNLISLYDSIFAKKSKIDFRGSVLKESQIPDDEQQRAEAIQEFKKNKKRKQNIKFIGFSLGIEVILVLLAIFLTQLEIVFNLLGAIGSNAITTGLPALFYFKLVDQYKNKANMNKRENTLYYTTKILFVYAIFLVVVCVTSEILKIAQE